MAKSHGVNWEVVHSGKSTGASLKLENNVLSQEYCARFVRIHGFGNDAKDKASRSNTSITEVEIWGMERWMDISCEEEVNGTDGNS
jgi:hypothetical protein